jgi:hypothetical protein
MHIPALQRTCDRRGGVMAAAVLSSTLLFAAACSDNSSSADKGDNAGAVTSASEASPPDAASLASSGSSTIPNRADGLWEFRHAGGAGTDIGTQTLCVAEGTDDTENVFSLIALNGNCSKYEIARAGDAWAFEFVCGSSEMTSTSKGTVRGDFSSAYTVEMTESDGTVEQVRTIKAARKGPCPADVAPGTLTTKMAE